MGPAGSSTRPLCGTEPGIACIPQERIRIPAIMMALKLPGGWLTLAGFWRIKHPGTGKEVAEVYLRE